MINITIEINGFHQLMQAEKHLIEEIIIDIEQLFQNSGFDKVRAKASMLFYECEEENTSLSRIVDILYYLHTMIHERSDEIPGITVFIQKSGLLRKGMGTESRINGIYLLPEEDGVWCSHDALDMINHFITYQEIDGYFKIVDFNRDNLSSGAAPELFHRGDILDRLLDHIFRMYEGKEKKIPVLTGPAGSGKRLIIQNVLRLIESKSEQQPWLHITRCNNIGPAYMTLLNGIVPDFFKQNTQDRTRNEKAVWDEMKGLIAIPFRSWSLSDTLLCFLNYLEAYRVKMEKDLLLPIIVVHGIDEQEEKVKELVFKILRDNQQANLFLPIVTMRNEDCSLFSEQNVHTVSFPVREWIEQLSSQSQTDISSPYQLYIPETAIRPGHKGEIEIERIVAVLKDSIEQVQSVYYCCTVLDGLVKKATLSHILSLSGIGKEEADQCLYQLVSLGLLTDTDRYYPTLRRNQTKVFNRLKIDCTRLDHAIEEGVLQDYNSIEFYKIIETADRIQFTPEGWLSIYRLLAERILSDMEILLLPQVQRAVDLLHARHPAIEQTVLLLASMWDGEMDLAEKYYRALFPAEPGAGPKEELTGWAGILKTYAEGEYLWRKRGEGERVLKKVKQALLQVQEEDFPELESRAIILLGKVMLTNNRMTEASEYFRQARQKTFDTQLSSAACESIALTSLSYFLTGDYSLSYSHALASEQKARTSGRRVWERYAMMLRARIQFELGRYREAYQLLQELLTHDRLYFEGGRHDFFMSWLARASIYQGYIDTAREILASLSPTSETLFFQAEAHLLNRDLETANDYITKALSYLEDESHDIYPIGWLPIDGFEPYENLALKIPGTYNMVRQMLYALSGFCLYELGRPEDSQEAFSLLFAQEKITRQDPYRHLYYYFRTITLPSTAEKEELNMVTYLSKAFQSLQKIAGRISDPADRRSYTTENYWNSKLFNLSRHYKLV